MQVGTEFVVTLSTELHRRLIAEAERLGLPLEWVVAALVADTVEAAKTRAA